MGDTPDKSFDLEAAVAAADVASLLPAVAQLTGHYELLDDAYRPDPARLIEPDAGVDPAALEAARAAAVDALRDHWSREPGTTPVAPPTAEQLSRMLAFLVGDAAVTDYHDLLVEELSPAGVDTRAPSWHKDQVAPDRTFTAAVIGAGMSGLLAAHRLRQAGIAVTVFEKNPDVGGTWFDNTYPGCRVDVPNNLYSYSFAQRVWPNYFSSQESLLGYFQEFADDFGVRDSIRFDTEVLESRFDEAEQVWHVTVRHADADADADADAGAGAGASIEETMTFNVVCSAVGQLNRPSFPGIAGHDRFEGTSFHSARWDHDVDLGGKRVAVIGTGASAIQFIPPVADLASELVVFQRTPPWLAPTPEYHDAVAPELSELVAHLPEYGRWDRLWQFWKMHEGLLPAAEVDPTWEPQDQSVSLLNDIVRLLLTDYLREQFPEDDLFEQVLPHYPPIAKRVVRDNGIWSRTLHRDNVELVSTSIAEITPQGVRTSDGVERPFDVIIYGTGFEASRFLVPMRVIGVDGVDLHQRWNGDARAYLGLTVPHFPNFFMLYGPNTNIVINGSIIYFSECETRYVVECVRELLEGGHASLDCRPDVHDSYNVAIDAANRSMAWGASTVNSWYRNANGRVSQNWPYSLLEYWQRTKYPDLGDYIVR